MNVMKSARRLAAGKDSICTSCLRHLSRAASTAAAVAPDEPSPIPQHTPPVTSTAPRKAYRVLAGVALSRPPLLTRPLTSFEKAFYLYQKRLNERTALPFSRYFYYKKGTPADVEWKRKYKARQTAARDIGRYSGYGAEAWADEVMLGDQTAEPESVVEALIRDAEGKDVLNAQNLGDAEASGEAIAGGPQAGEATRTGNSGTIARPLPRRTEADEKNDTKSLSRLLDRSLYLLVRNQNGRWRFPEDKVVGRENLHQAAERVLVQAGGINMNTWVVGNHPIAHHQCDFGHPVRRALPPTSPTTNTPTTTTTTTTPPSAIDEQRRIDEMGEKVFIMKARIMGGQADLSKNAFGDQDFQWLAKEEVQGLVTRQYWSSVRHMLAER